MPVLPEKRHELLLGHGVCLGGRAPGSRLPQGKARQLLIALSDHEERSFSNAKIAYFLSVFNVSPALFDSRSNVFNRASDVEVCEHVKHVAGVKRLESVVWDDRVAGVKRGVQGFPPTL